MVQASDLQIAEVLASLGDPMRVALLRRLSTPHTLEAIHTRAVRHEGMAEHDVSPDAFHQKYLEPLVDLGVITFREPAGGGAAEYVLNQPALYALAEKVNDVGRLRAAPARGLAVRAPPLPPTFQIATPCLVLVKGLWEGRTYPLPRRPKGSWVIGRGSQVDVCLDYDPYVGAQNTSIEWEAGAYRVHDLQGGGGTFLNFRELGRGASQPLRNGDVVGLGRSLLMARL